MTKAQENKSVVISPRDANACLIRLKQLLMVKNSTSSESVSSTTPLRSVYPLAAKPGQQKFFGLMPSMLLTGDLSKTLYFGAKCLSVFLGEGGPVQSHISIYALFDGQDGAFVACYDAAEMTAKRTAASFAVAARALLLNPENKRPLQLGIAGTGEQARRHVAVLVAMCPIAGRGASVATVRIWGWNKKRLAACIADCQREVGAQISVAPAASVAQLVASSNIPCTLTSSSEPMV